MQEIKLNALTRKTEEQKQIESKVAISKDSDPFSSNVLLTNLSKEAQESDLAREFSKYGPIASVRIFTPSSTTDPFLSIKSGYVNFMSRDDAKKCIKEVNGKILLGQPVNASFGKRLPKACFPLVISKSPKAQELHLQSLEKTDKGDFITVETPSDPRLKMVIDLVSEFVAREGCAFEQHISELHKMDPLFAFMREEDSRENLYFKWKTFSLSQGDSSESWRKAPFRIVQGGKVWLPPTTIVPDDFSTRESRGKKNDITFIVPSQHGTRRKPGRVMAEKKRTQLESLLRTISKDRRSIKESMGFCIDNSEYATEIADTITESLTIAETEIEKKVARLFLVSDILHNSDSNVRNSSAYRSEFQRNLKEIFEGLQESYSKVSGRMTAGKMKEDILMVLRVWQAWSLFPAPFLDALENKFLMNETQREQSGVFTNNNSEDIDGVPLEDDIDGFELNF